MRIQIERLEHHADAPAHGVDVDAGRHDVDALDADRARGRFLEAVPAAQQRRLARARRPDDEYQLARGDLEVDALQDLQLAERLVKPRDIQDHWQLGVCRVGSWPSMPGTP